MYNLDLVIISSSRPKLLPYLIESFKKSIYFDGQLHTKLHEDFVYPEESKKVIDYVKKSKFFDEIYQHEPNIGIGKAIEFMLDKCKNNYVLMLQDDWEFELPIDLNQLIWTMEKYKNDINAIVFNKRKNMKAIDGYKFKEFRFDTLDLLLDYHWPLGPGIWRKEYVKKRWEISPKSKSQEGWWNRIIKGQKRTFENDILKKVGCYIYGPLQYPRVVRHLGNSWVTKPWGNRSRNKNGYGGCIELDVKKQSVQNRAPWLSPAPSRPLYTKNKQQEIKELKKQGLIEDENFNSN